jgi:hypothetical protein
MPRGMVLSTGLGLPGCWRGGQRKSRAIALANKMARMAWDHDGQERALQGTRRTRGVNEIVPAFGTM